MSLMDDFKHLKISLKCIQAATNNFGDKPIGNGGFGDVYKGELILQKGVRMVAFKRLDRKFGQGDVEFWKEITLLSGLKHKNLATLLHFCNEDKERILVYKYASRGSLDKYLNDASLAWAQRLDICLGAARGIAYLHDPKKTQQRILHRDIKSSNILLNDKWTAKVSDFGLSKIFPANQARSYVVSNICGTPGYCDPVFFETGILSKECDVYSFGVVLFEVMCGRLCCIYDKEKCKKFLVQNWKNCYVENRLVDIILPGLKEQINEESLSTFAAIANRCLNRNHKERPQMVEIVKELEAAIHQQVSFSIISDITNVDLYLQRQELADTICCYQNSYQRKHYVAKMPVSYNPIDKFDHLKIHLDNVKLATNNFDEDHVIGIGGFGKVYRGELLLPEGRRSTVCFKRLDRIYGQGDTEFLKEIKILSRYKHENLISLMGFCDEGNEKILIIEYASHKSLDLHLSSTYLTWTQRLKICVGLARGLYNLHQPMKTQKGVIHRDVKSSSILLNENWCVKITDLGMSKVVASDEPQTDHVDNVVGTIGYCDPLYTETGIFSKKSDVYSFGVVMFEVMCGKLCFEFRNQQLNLLVHKWKEVYDQKRLKEIIFKDLMEQMDLGSLDTFSSIAYQCMKKARDERPSMSEIIKELELALEQQEHFEEMQRISSISKNELLMRFPKGILVGDGERWLSKLENGRVCEIVSAIECISADSFLRDNIENSRFLNVLRGVMHNGFKVEVKTHFLSPKILYNVNLVFKHSGTDHGTHIPFKFKLEGEGHYSNSCLIHAREDGWLGIELHQFTSCKKAHDFKIEFVPLFELTSSSVEYFLEGIEFRPVEYVSRIN